MRRDLRLLLQDIDLAADAIEKYTSCLSQEDYESNSLVQDAVERNFTIIGEAMVRISRHAPHILEQIDEAREFIGFRNVLTHGYDVVNDSSVWTTIQNDLPHLRRTVQTLISELSGESPSR